MNIDHFTNILKKIHYISPKSTIGQIISKSLPKHFEGNCSHIEDEELIAALRVFYNRLFLSQVEVNGQFSHEAKK